MAWVKTAEDRRRDSATYDSPEYRRNRAIKRRQANGTCEECGHRHERLQCDHIVPKAQGGGNGLANLQMLCSGEGSCKCHEKKTYEQRGTHGRRAADPPFRPRTRW